VPCSWLSCLAAWHISVNIKDTWVSTGYSHNQHSTLIQNESL
jgi:hypothetical protein